MIKSKKSRWYRSDQKGRRVWIHKTQSRGDDGIVVDINKHYYWIAWAGEITHQGINNTIYLAKQSVMKCHNK